MLDCENQMAYQSVLESSLSPDYLRGDMRRSLLHSFCESGLRFLLVATAVFEKLLYLFRRESFHLLEGVNSLQELQSALAVYAAKGIKSLWEVVFESMGYTDCSFK